MGDVIATGDQLGILGRIVSIALFANYIEFTIEPATLPELFKNLEIDAQSAPLHFVVTGEAGGEAKLFLKNAQGKTSQAIAQAEINCEGGVVNLANIPLEFDVTHQLGTVYKLDAVSEDLNHIEITSIGKVEITGGLAQLEIDVTPYVKCEIKFRYHSIALQNPAWAGTARPGSGTQCRL